MRLLRTFRNLVLAVGPGDQLRSLFGWWPWRLVTPPAHPNRFGMRQFALGQNHNAEPKRDRRRRIEKIRTLFHESLHVPRVQTDQLRPTAASSLILLDHF